MIKSLHLKSFRRFEDFRLSDLARVCLLVGENNSGKTSVLEAAHFWALADSRALRIAANRRGEEVYVQLEPDSTLRPWFPTIQNFIHGHEIAPGVVFLVETPERSTRLEIVSIGTIKSKNTVGRFVDLGARVRRSDNQTAVEEFTIQRDGAFDADRDPYGEIIRHEISLNVQFFDSELSPGRLRFLWDAVNEQGIEQQVVESIRVVAPQVEGLHFASLPAFTSNARVGVKYRPEGARTLLPIGSLGSAAFRLLELGVTLVYCQSGLCLIDDIDSGLHWSAMGDMWRLVIETARRNNTQVFATTHSYDCIKGLAWVCENFPELAEDVSVQSIKPELDHAVGMPGDRLPFAVGQEIEVR